jgi:hypothetical protein
VPSSMQRTMALATSSVAFIGSEKTKSASRSNSSPNKPRDWAGRHHRDGDAGARQLVAQCTGEGARPRLGSAAGVEQAIGQHADEARHVHDAARLAQEWHRARQCTTGAARFTVIMSTSASGSIEQQRYLRPLKVPASLLAVLSQ